MIVSQRGQVVSASVTLPSKEEINRETVQKFMDQYFEKGRKEYHVPGAAVAVVKDGKELYCAGYGSSDLKGRNPIDPNETTFPACSVSKLFTATAIMQLVEQGKIDLNADITTYLNDVTIQNSFSKPITCAELLTHTSGLDEQSELNGSTLAVNKIKRPADYFNDHAPKVIREPGTTSCYSNMGYNLLGYLIEKASGESYESYVTSHILDPLGMKRASIRIENSHMSDGYQYEDGNYTKLPFAYQYTSGSSGIIGSVTDMEPFMLMHLNGGDPILSKDTEDMMQAKQFANNKIFAGMGYGFVRSDDYSVLIIKHEGALPGYATTMLLIPSENIGIYVATNCCTGICFDFEDAFMNHFYSRKQEKGFTKSKFDATKYIGTYRSYDGIAKTNLMKFAVIFDTTDINITKGKDGSLYYEGYDQRKKMRRVN